MPPPAFAAARPVHQCGIFLSACAFDRPGTHAGHRLSGPHGIARVNRPRLTPAEKEDYVQHFLENKPVGKIDFRTIDVGCTTALDSGLYTFTFGKTGAQVKARYT
jgi:hypothetical protein